MSKIISFGGSWFARKKKMQFPWAAISPEDKRGRIDLWHRFTLRFPITGSSSSSLSLSLSLSLNYFPLLLLGSTQKYYIARRLGGEERQENTVK